MKNLAQPTFYLRCESCRAPTHRTYKSIEEGFGPCGRCGGVLKKLSQPQARYVAKVVEDAKMTEEEKQLAHKRSALNRMAGNIAAGLVMNPSYDKKRIAEVAADIALKIMNEVERITK